MLAYTTFKALHVLGVILLIGNVTVTAVWKAFADRSGQPVVVAFAQRLVTITDWWLTLTGVFLLLVGGVGTALTGGIPLFSPRWMRWSEILLVVSGAIWVGILIPLQRRQARDARGFAGATRVPDDYRRDARRWLWWGIVATVPLVIAVYLMIAKP